ncbi:MAG: GIY-YIG nuclease family protein [Microgenomates group bacterium]
MIDLKSLPTASGIYIYRNAAGEIMYVGKAINLKKRVSQYFQRDDALGPKTQTLVSQIDSIETKVVGSEIEALILEASYIKKYHPKYNSLLKDDRSYQFICITRDKLPRIYSVFGSQADTTQHLYGPFPSGLAVRSLLKTMRRIFPYYSQKKHPKTLCLYCHLGICPGPSPDSHIYRHNILLIKKILSGKFKLVQRRLQKEMEEASVNQQYETALLVRNQLDALNYVVSGWHNLNNLFEQINLPEDRSSSAISELETTLQPYLNIKNIHRIECFDISQMVDKYFVGSMTVWQNGHLDSSAYRQFKINTKVTQDDQFMIKEVVYRRLQHPEWGTPDLIVVDGGKPQLTAALSLVETPYMASLQNQVNIIGLAKKFETIVIKSNDDFIEINLPTNSKALLLLESLRNEAHRFANRYRRSLMSKSTT